MTAQNFAVLAIKVTADTKPNTHMTSLLEGLHNQIKGAKGAYRNAGPSTEYALSQSMEDSIFSGRYNWGTH